MTDLLDPREHRLTAVGADADGDAPKPDDKDRDESGVGELEPKDEPNAGESPLG